MIYTYKHNNCYTPTPREFEFGNNFQFNAASEEFGEPNCSCSVPAQGLYPALLVLLVPVALLPVQDLDTRPEFMSQLHDQADLLTGQLRALPYREFSCRSLCGAQKPAGQVPGPSHQALPSTPALSVGQRVPSVGVILALHVQI